jgi:hypothetical protein
MNYTQAYKSLRNYGCPADKARRALDDAADSAPALVMGTAGWIRVTFSAKRGFMFTDDKEGK